MLTILEIVIIILNIIALVWPLLPIKRVPKFLDFMPFASVVFLVIHLFLDKEPVRLRMIPIYIFTITIFLITMRKIFRDNRKVQKRNKVTVLGRLLALLMLAICVSIPTVVLPFHSLPEPTGSFNVGTVVCDFTDKNRVETFSKDEGDLRKIAVQIWYPSDRTGSEVLYDISGATISKSQHNYPVLIFSHGAFGMRMSNASTFRELASHGYIVASIDHTYQAFYTAFADGKGVPVNMEFLNNAIGVSIDDIPADKTFKITRDWLELRTADIELVIDSLKSGELGTTGEFLKGHMDLDRIGLFGHSLGGAASAHLSRKLEDVKAVIVMDGTMIGDITGLDSNNKEIITDETFSTPLMLMYGSLYEEQKARETSYLPNINAYNNATDAVYSLVIKDSGHLNFTDLPRISPFLAEKLGVGDIDSFECIKIVNDYSLAFFDKHVKGQPSPLLDGSVSSNEVEFNKRVPNTVGKK